MIRFSCALRRPASLGLALLALLPALAGCGGNAAAPGLTATAIPSQAAATPVPATPSAAPASATPAPPAPSAAPANTIAPPPAPTDTPAPPPSDTPFPGLPTVTPLPATAPPTPFATPTTAAGEATPPPPSGDADIVFVLSHTLALINADGSNLRHLAITGDLSQPRWSPDKARIAYLSGYGAAADLWVANRDGSNPIRLTNSANVREEGARWSPDGRTLAFTRTADTSHDGQIDSRDTSEVWLVDADGANPRRLADGQDPAWAPDGKRIAFASNGRRDANDPYGAGNTIDMINAQGQNRWSPIKIANVPQQTKLVNPQADFNAGTNYLRYPDWAPNNQAIAFMAIGHSGLIVTATDKGAQVTLRDFDYEGGYDRVFWSPDGAKLAYEVLPPSGIEQIAVLTLSDKKRVGFGSSHEGSIAVSPAWAPDSARIAYIQGVQSAEAQTAPAGPLAIGRLDAPTSPQVIVPDGASDPDWR
jgi:Tol biopolymer transport system component